MSEDIKGMVATAAETPPPEPVLEEVGDIDGLSGTMGDVDMANFSPPKRRWDWSRASPPHPMWVQDHQTVWVPAHAGGACARVPDQLQNQQEDQHGNYPRGLPRGRGGMGCMRM